MLGVRNRPLFTTEYDDARRFRPDAGSVYVFGTGVEDRGSHVFEWRDAADDIVFLELVESGRSAIEVANGDVGPVLLRSRDRLTAILEPHLARLLYLDITGLSHHVWIPLVRVAVEMGFELRVVYVEPRDYSYSRSPRENDLFDLSERTLGISPLPLFASLAEPDEDKVCFIPLLGFEGGRLAHLTEEVQPLGGQIHPVIGIPGFRAEYPFFAYQANIITLRDTQAYRNVRYARANCPFSLAYTLDDVFAGYPDDHFFKIGLVGTKPHALGAVLRALSSKRTIELVYDHAKRQPKRSVGKAHCHVYAVSEFLNDHGGENADG
jgi:hypothetical protein